MDGPVQVPGHEVVRERPPLGYPAAVRALAGCFAATARLIWRRRMHLPSQRVGTRLRFADGTSARVFRETAVDRGAMTDPCVLVEVFRLRAVRGRGHAAFRRESLLNTSAAAAGWYGTSTAGPGPSCTARTTWRWWPASAICSRSRVYQDAAAALARDWFSSHLTR